MEQLRANPGPALEGYKAGKDADRLAALLERAADAYYNSGEPLLPDDVFDMARDRLAEIAPEHPFLARVGAPIRQGDKVRLPYWMGSMNKIKDSEQDLQRWVSKHPDGSYVVSDKLDGNSAMIVFGKDAAAMRMYSRGDGSVGQDISQLLPFIQGVPPPGRLGQGGLAVRGELIISRKDWAAIRHVGANARNVVAGALHRKVPDPNIARNIRFVAYEVVHPRNQKPSDALASLTRMGFEVVEHRLLKNKDALTLDSLSKVLMERKEKSPFECDGIVVAHDGVHRIVKGSNPSYAFAFKSIYTHDEAEVVVAHVEWNVSKDGYLKPTVVFPPVSIAGVTIQRATGFNGAFIEGNRIGPGARIVVIRSGDVIPHVVRVLAPAFSGNAQMPEVPYEWTDTRVDVVVKDKANNKEQRLRTLEHFAKTMDIPNVAVGTLRKLADAGYDTIPALLSVTQEDLLKIDGFKAVSAGKVAKALRDVRDKGTCVRMMAASNIFGRGLGEKKLQMIARALPQILERKLPSLEELTSVDGVGPATAEGFHQGLMAFFTLMDEIGMPCRPDGATGHPVQRPILPAATSGHTEQNSQRGDLSRVVAVFTGFRNKAWEEAITAAGGKVTTSVSRNTTHVVAADPTEASSKLEKARTLNIPILSKDEFAKLLGLF